MNFVFEKTLLSLLFYTQNHSFIVHVSFFKTFIPILVPYFLWKAGESLLLVLFLESVLLSLLFTLNWHLRDINTEFFPRSLHACSNLRKLQFNFPIEQTDEIIPAFNITTFSKMCTFCVRALEILINYFFL